MSHRCTLCVLPFVTALNRYKCIFVALNNREQEFVNVAPQIMYAVFGLRGWNALKSQTGVVYMLRCIFLHKDRLI